MIKKITNGGKAIVMEADTVVYQSKYKDRTMQAVVQDGQYLIGTMWTSADDKHRFFGIPKWDDIIVPDPPVEKKTE